MLRTILSAGLFAALFGLVPGAATEARAEGSVTAQHAAWQACLQDAFAVSEAGLSSRGFAADSALRTCRDSESAYLAALGASPLVDGEDVARVRPALLAKARSQLIGLPRSRQL